MSLGQAAKYAAQGGTGSGYGLGGSFMGALGKFANSVGEAAGRHISNRATEFENAANEAINSYTGNELTDEEWDLRFGQMSKLKRRYIVANKEGRAKILRDVSNLKNNQDQHNLNKLDILESALGSNGVNKNWMGTPQGYGVQGIVDGTTAITYNEKTGQEGYMLSNDGDMENFETAKDFFIDLYSLKDKDGSTKFFDSKIDPYSNTDESKKMRDQIINVYKAYMITDGEKTEEELDNMFGEKWYSKEDIKGIIKNQSVDVDSKRLILSQAKDYQLKSMKLTSGPGNFNYQVAYDDVRDTIVGQEDASKRSLAMDEMIPGSNRTWFKDMQEALMNSSYEQLGIPLTKDQAKEMDPTEGTPITNDDARVIIRNIMKEEALFSDFLTSYYTKFMEQNWNKGALNRTNWNPITTQTTPTTTPTATTEETTINVEGGQIVNGKFVANK